MIREGVFMKCVIVGKQKKPYDFDGKKGISCKVSIYINDYLTDTSNGVLGEGRRYVELRCPVFICDALKIEDSVFIETDDDLTRIKSCMIKTDDGGYFPVE